MSFFVSGASGFLGGYVIPELLKSSEKIFLLVRPQSVGKISDDLKNHKQIKIVLGDISAPNVLAEENALEALSSVTDFIHMAANYNLDGTLAEAYVNNVVGTQNILDLAAQLPNLKRFHDISTIAIAGDFKGRFHETMFNVGQKFSNPYASTKFRAEGLLGSWKRDDVKRIIYRMGIIVGDTKTGYIPKVDGPYYFFNSLRDQKKLWQNLTRFGKCPLPYSSEAELPMIPVDTAAEFLGTMISNPSDVPGKIRTYHLSGAHTRVEQILERGFEEFSYHCKPIPLPKFLVPKFLLPRLNLPVSAMDYMYQCIHYDDKHVKTDFPSLKAPTFEEYSDALFSYIKGQHA
jgi:thioester reductase-like protein